MTATDGEGMDPVQGGTPVEAADPIVEAPSPGGFPVVGIGASAGGLAAFEAFFSGMPSDRDPGMAFVLVQHLAPDHKSILTDLIRRYTRMQVSEVEDGMTVQPNCAYIIPPNRDMAFLNGALQLLEPDEPRGRRLPIDFFFRSLAQDQRHRAIGIVLSGTGSDGTAGVRAIKGEGGMVMAQNPETTEYDGMPHSAIATGLVDFVLPPAEMPAQLMTYAAHAFGRPKAATAAPAPRSENALKRIFVLLRAQTGHDFSLYKPNTIARRIERRMAVHQIETLDAYVLCLQRTPGEVEALFRDLLIGVTSFFRDPEAFRLLEELVIPRLFSGKPAGSTIRVWAPGCSTGEEAYSVAILLQERLEMVRQGYKVQVFATDIDSQAIAVARAGLYPASISADVSAERLARFFQSEADGNSLRIFKGIRDMLVFSEQDVIKDPPFSRLDLIVCRNLLIYFGSELQRKLIPLFHYALRPSGMLFLGTSESVGEFADLFSTVERKAKIYQRVEDLHGTQRAALGRLLPSMTVPETTAAVGILRSGQSVRPPLRELIEQEMLHHLAAAGVLVNAQGDVFYLHGRTGMYLEPSPGETGISNIMKMAREGLRRELTTALHRAAATREVVQHRGLRVRTNGDFTAVDLTIRPVVSPENSGRVLGGPTALDPPLFVVVLEATRLTDHKPADEPEALAPAREALPESESERRITALRQELRAKEEYLQTTNEELETANEELKSSNEEMQSVNEELQSTNEELETSKEELQSVNEELATVNAELLTKVADLSRANNDMSNLLAGTGIGIIFVDHHLRIMRFTPAATRVVNLIPSDVGRPVAHVASNLTGYTRLVADAQTVLDTLVPREVDVLTTEGRWFAMRIQPYRTLDNVIEGAVITFVDITDVKRVETEVRETDTRFQQLVEALPQLVWSFGPDLNCQYVCPRWSAYSGVPEAQLRGGGWLETLHPQDRVALVSALGVHLPTAPQPLETEIRIRSRDGQYRRFVSRISVVSDGSQGVARWIGLNAEVVDSGEDERAVPENVGGEGE